MSPLPSPGDILIYSPKSINLKSNIESSSCKSESLGTQCTTPSSIRLVQWNIERGYEMPKILEILRDLNADVVALQEVDIGCKRSGGGNQAEQLANELGMTCAFVCEFHELEHEMRADRDQSIETLRIPKGGGVHGNAILTRHPATFRVVDHQHHPYDWEKHGHHMNEPREGRRFTIVGDIMPKNGFPRFLMYSAHLEIFCGLSGRVAQISDILADSSRSIDLIPRQALFGDLNTSAHGIARFSPRFCRDSFRWRSLGTNESTWIDSHVFAFHTLLGERNTFLEGFQRPDLFPEVVLRNARNPGFVDPWDPRNDITLQSRSYFGLYKAKLDWTLLRGLTVVRQWMGNDDYAASDHKYLALDVVPSHPIAPSVENSLHEGFADSGEKEGSTLESVKIELDRFIACRRESLRRRTRGSSVEKTWRRMRNNTRTFWIAGTVAALGLGMLFVLRRSKR